MDHNLEDSLTLGSTMEEMDFGRSDVVVTQEDLNLVTSSNEESIPMEFEHIEEQPMLIGSANEEIIVPDFMGDQFNLQEYSIQDDETTGMTTVENSNQSMLAAQSDTMLDLQYQPQTVTSVRSDGKGAPPYIAVKAALSAQPIPSKTKDTIVLTTVPRQVPIAPKPPKNSNKFTQVKPLPIAPKPIALVSNFLKKGPVVQQRKGNAVLAQIGKQIVVLPQGGAQKIKVVNTNTGVSTVQYLKSGGDQTQLIPAKNITGIQSSKPVVAKVIVQGQSNAESNEPAVITKIIPTSTGPQPRYIIQPNTVPIGKEVVMASPTKHGVRFTKKQQQIVAIKSPTSTIVPVTSGSTAAPLKKMIITPNPTQNVILKTTAPPKAQMTKDGKVVVQSQRSQLHQINVPGKGIQYIRLITNQAPATTVSTTKTPTSSIASKGQLIQVSTGKASGSQPPPLVFTGTIAPSEKFLGTKKLVRIAAAPVSTKSSAGTQQVSIRSAQSLLAPLSPMEGSSKMTATPEASLDEVSANDWDVGGVGETVEVMLKSEPSREMEEEMEADAEMSGEGEGDSAVDSKAALQELLARDGTQGSVQVETMDSTEDVQSVKGQTNEHPLIVISSNYMAQDSSMSEEPANQEDVNNMMNFNAEIAYQSEDTPPDSDVTPSEFVFRPKRACNCTKSQCLKLYCDCFANGEFCNQCNCHNCLNNLENEELRQKAIRTCLERNPNAFRPKIGKSKFGGPEIIRRHTKGCNCKRSGCLKNYCECYEAKIACTATCKCVGCRNVEDALQRRRAANAPYRPPPSADLRQPCNFMTTEVIEAVCQCLVAAAAEGAGDECARGVLEEFSRCLQDIIGASRHSAPAALLTEERA